jgi:hypothetical protein
VLVRGYGTLVEEVYYTPNTPRVDHYTKGPVTLHVDGEEDQSLGEEIFILCPPCNFHWTLGIQCCVEVAGEE